MVVGEDSAERRVASEDDYETVSHRFERAAIDGRALLLLNESALREGLGLPDEVVEMLMPWVARMRSANIKVWAFGVHCCARWMNNMPSKEAWARALLLPELGPLRPKEATVHRIGRSGRRFLEAFKSYHQIHQWFHVVLGPCTSLCNRLPNCDSNGCEMLLPLHAGYDLLLRAWAAIHPKKGLCTEDDSIDFPLDTCLPYLFPLRSTREECATKYADLPYEYDGLMRDWVDFAMRVGSATGTPQ